MKRTEALDIAERASLAPVPKPGKNDGLARFGRPVEDLARFVESAPDAGAEALYIFANAGYAGRPSWLDQSARVRVQFEIFRATYLVLLVFVRLDEARAQEQARAKQYAAERPGAHGELTFADQAPGFGDRVILTR